VLKLLKKIKPSVAARDHHDRDLLSASSRNEEGKTAAAATQPLEMGRALAASFLRSAICIATGRPVTPVSPLPQQRYRPRPIRETTTTTTTTTTTL
jgi:hypothetical protein